MRRRMLALIPALLAAAAAVGADYRLETVVADLSWPWSIAFLPDGELLVAELDGQLRRIDRDGKPGPDIDAVPPVYFAGQGGLFDVVLDREFASNGRLFLSFAAGSAKANGTAVASATLLRNALSDVKIIFRVAERKDTPVHYGGRLAQLQDGTLLLTTGDGFDYREAAQDRRSQLGKTLRFNSDGSAVAGGPFPDSPYVWSFGHRNPQGLVVAQDGSVLLHEHGPRGGDEVNRIEPGVNYGWPAITYGLDYNGAYVSPFTEWEGMAQPLHYWTPSIAPSGFALYSGHLFPQWQGSLFVGALVSHDVRRLTYAHGSIVEQESLFGELGARIRDVRNGPDGALYLVTDGPEGSIVRVLPSALID